MSEGTVLKRPNCYPSSPHKDGTECASYLFGVCWPETCPKPFRKLPRINCPGSVWRPSGSPQVSITVQPEKKERQPEVRRGWTELPEKNERALAGSGSPRVARSGKSKSPCVRGFPWCIAISVFAFLPPTVRPSRLQQLASRRVCVVVIPHVCLVRIQR